LLVCRSAAGLAREIGEWDEGFAADGRHWLATTADHAPTALRYVRKEEARKRSQADRSIDRLTHRPTTPYY
jgi:hypothetical protein